MGGPNKTPTCYNPPYKGSKNRAPPIFGSPHIGFFEDPIPKAQHGPKAPYDMVYGSNNSNYASLEP